MATTSRAPLFKLLDLGGLPPPLDICCTSLVECSDYTARCRAVVLFFYNMRQQYPLQQLIGTMFSNTVPPALQELLLYSLLDTGYSDVTVIRQVLRLNSLRRLFIRRERGGELCRVESNILETIARTAEIDSSQNFRACSSYIRNITARILRRQLVYDADRRLIVTAIKAEAAALHVRARQLSERIADGNPALLAPRLARISMLQEHIRRARDISTRLWRNQPLQAAYMTIEQEWTRPGFEAHCASFAACPGLAELSVCLKLQQQALVPTQSLIALCTLCRWTDGDRNYGKQPVAWAHAALASCAGGCFRIDAPSIHEACRGAIEKIGIHIEDNAIRGHVDNYRLLRFINADALSRPCPDNTRACDETDDTAIDGSEEEESEPIRDIIRRHINNDALVSHLLDKPAAYNAPGLVEFVALRSRSQTVLTKIAGRSELYSGAANTGVPKALLTNPMKIPMPLLRKFLHPSYFSVKRLKTMIESSSLMRPEVRSTIKTIVAAGQY